MNNNLLYGKNQIKRIVNLEVNNDIIDIFTREKTGKLQKQQISNKYFDTANNRINAVAKAKGE